MRHAVLLLLVLGCSAKPGRIVRVAAASDLARAFEELGKAFEAKTHIKPVFSFDSSGLLAKRIDQGAPYYLFASAGKQFVDDAIKNGKCDPASMRPYARGRIVVWCPNGVQAPTQLADLADPRFRRIAIANPEHAPYGAAAKQALEKAGIWDKLADRVKYGENVQSTMQFAKTGAVDAAIVALSLAVVTDGGAFLPIDQSQYDALDQQLVVCGNGEEADAAHQLADFINSPEGREVMTRYGFLLPTEQPPTPKPRP
ncbi:MAG: molybdate ABC transporter substrate-binding protein [Kofleriaceae bacterium]